MTPSRTASYLALLTAGLIFVPSVEAANVVDQRQEIISNFDDYIFGSLSSDLVLVQTFQPSTTNLSGVGIRFNLNGLDPKLNDPNDWLSLNVYRGNEWLSPIDPSFAIDANGWVTSFWTPFAVVAGETYSISFAGFSYNQAPPYSAYVSISDDYSHGRLQDRIVVREFGLFFTDLLSRGGNFDAVFRTYTYAASGAVPEPANWALFIAGFGLIGAALRCRRAHPATIG